MGHQLPLFLIPSTELDLGTQGPEILNGLTANIPFDYVKIAWENVIFHSYVKLPEGVACVGISGHGRGDA